MRFLNSSIALLGAVASMNFGLSSASLVMSPPDDETIEDHYIVVMKNDKAKPAEELEALSKTVHSPLKSAQDEGTSILTGVMNGFATDMTRAEAEELAKRSDVLNVYEDAKVKAWESYGRWGLDRIDQEDLPIDGDYEPTLTNGGEGVTAYIMDTGIRLTHQDFENRARFLVNKSNDGQDTDCNGHGTHVAGTVGGKFSGVAKKVSLVDVKVLSCSGSGSYSGIIAAFDDIYADHQSHGGPSTVNMSLGGGRYEPVNAAIEAIVANGVTVVVAAGNSNRNACDFSPASEETAITVASSTSADQRSGFSNFGPCVDIFAPGSGILSAWKDTDTQYRSISGTSMASPHVCGATALYLSAYPDATPAEIEAMIKRDALEDKISDSRSENDKLLYVAAEFDTPVASPVASPVAGPPVAVPTSEPSASPTDEPSA